MKENKRLKPNYNFPSRDISDNKKCSESKNFTAKLINMDDNSERSIKIQPWNKVKEIKSKLSNILGVQSNNLRLFYQNLEMINSLTMLDYQIIDSANPKIYFNLQNNTKKHDFGIWVYAAFPANSKMKLLISEITKSFYNGLVPTMLLGGTSGTYNLKGLDKNVIAVFKPIDEEAFAPNNQKGCVEKFGHESFRPGILSGEGSIREVAAYLIDKENTFDIPETTFVEILHESFTKNSIEMMSFEAGSLHKMRNSIVHNYILENLVAGKVPKKAYAELNGLKDDNDEDEILSTANFRKKYGSLQRFIKNAEVSANFGSDLYDLK